jgi:hypothetical protein
MKRKYIAIVVFLLLVLSTSTPVSADMGPKASLDVHIKGCDEEYSFELLTYERYLSIDEIPRDELDTYSYYKDDFPEFFYTYMDDDQYASYSLFSVPSAIRLIGTEDGTTTFRMNYIAPRNFKIALYIDDTGVLIVSDIVETTLFESEVTWDLSGESFTTNQEGIGVLSGTIVGDPAGRVWTKTLVQTLIRVVFTVTIELGILLLFGIRKKHLFIQIGILNVITQSILSAIVITSYLTGGALIYIFLLIIGEFFVITGELIACLFIFKGHVPIWKTIVYVLLGNVASMIIGHLVLGVLLLGV